MAHDTLWQPMPNTRDNAHKLEVSTLTIASSNAPLLTNLSFEHGFFTFSNFAQKDYLKSSCVLASGQGQVRMGQCFRVQNLVPK
jgi:hypothetical protein